MGKQLRNVASTPNLETLDSTGKNARLINALLLTNIQLCSKSRIFGKLGEVPKTPFCWKVASEALPMHNLSVEVAIPERQGEMKAAEAVIIVLTLCVLTVFVVIVKLDLPPMDWVR